MQPVRYDLQIYKGQTWEQSFTFKTAGTTPTPIDLTGATVRAQIRPSDNSQILTAEFTVSNEGTSGVVYLALTSEITATLPVGTQAWDLKVTDANDVVNYWVKGNVIITGRVTE